MAVLLSGGVDSSLALRLLQAAGHVCTAFYLQIWFHEDFRNSWDACPWEDDLAFCRQVHLTCHHGCNAVQAEPFCCRNIRNVKIRLAAGSEIVSAELLLLSTAISRYDGAVFLS